ncbi:MAG TPA: mannose-1-phosphate guanylyltransferase [Anaerolineales bacterium]|nr:mannose-1-phosphate guanylyltransferase [Anaerolineales bacterium]HNA87859.1 mannose-1-phosphate guanylyltransferase [Anaerolineales bacterium]HNB34815.1 mannose-1-phosphate guanylyltransferase [Anaerolineales bacterium]HNC07230.1 mannose-1-phosphate guanylyltransferase [Anaerolineales bacterium]
MDYSHMYAVIMAGGGGTRLWPVSRKESPKQLLPLLGQETLFQSTVKRLKNLFPPERILVVTVEEQAREMKKQAPELPEENYLIEPAPRGTASVVGLAAKVLQKRDPDATMAILPSDHFIRNVDLFHYLLKAAFEVAENRYLVTLGITPTMPSTAYGYIQQGVSVDGDYKYPVYTVKSFKEKPDEQTAQQLLRMGDHSWNSGMFIWRADAIMNEIHSQMPQLGKALEQIGAAWGTANQNDILNSTWPGLKNETVDYGIMEKAERVAVLPAGGLGWSDVGSWSSLFEVLLPDMNGNIATNAALHLAHETHNTLVYGGSGDRLIVTIGVDDMVIVDTGDALMICKTDQSQKVKEVVEHLKKHRQEKFL